MADEFDDYMSKSGIDHTKVNEGYKIPAAGKCLIRFMQYIEMGLQKSSNPAYKDAREVHLGFEVVGKRHNETRDGVVSHPTIAASVNLTQSAKGGFIPLFKALNYNNTCQRITELLNGGYVSNITHVPSADGSKMYAKIKIAGEPWPISPPVKEDPEDPSMNTLIDIPKALSKVIRFVWEPTMLPDELYLSTWDSLYVEGQFQDGNSKNKWQEKIMKNLEWPGSRLERLLEARKSGVSTDLPDNMDASEEDVF